MVGYVRALSTWNSTAQNISLTVILSEGITVRASRFVSANISAAFGTSLLNGAFIRPLDDYLKRADGSLKLIRTTTDDFNRVYEQDGSVSHYNKDGTLINKWLPGIEIGSHGHSGNPMEVPTYLLHNAVMGTFLAAVGGGGGNDGRARSFLGGPRTSLGGTKALSQLKPTHYITKSR